jgi:hypothetical protein
MAKVGVIIEQRALHHWCVVGRKWHHRMSDDGKRLLQFREIIAEFSTRTEARLFVKEHGKEWMDAKAP